MSASRLPKDVLEKIPKIENPYPYQIEAINAILKQLKKHDRTHIVMACGTGKTRISLWVAERLRVDRIVVFVPSLALINQLMQEWLSITTWPAVNCLAVCSDESVTRGTDSIILNPDECDFPVTTDASEVHQFLKKERTGVTLVFCTYHSANVLAEGIKGLKPFVLGIFDESHKTAGRNGFGLALLDENLPIQKRLFMTATPRHYDINQENKEGEAKLVFSMDNEALYGKRAYTFSFRRAMELGVIVNYKVVISITESKGNRHQEPEIEEKIVALQKAVKKIPAVSKIISFHKTIEEAHHFSKHIQDNEKMPHFRSFHVSSLIPSQMRKSAMAQFEKSKHSIVTNARCLTEGIDAPAVDMVAFLNKKRSKIDIIQAIGRALRKSPQKELGYVFLPLFVQKLKGESLEQAVERADYREIWEVLQALSEYDESLEATIQNLTQEKGRTGTISKGLEDYIEIIAHDTVNVSLQKKLSKKIDVLIIEKLGNSWNEMYGQLLIFKENNNHCNVPTGYLKNLTLANWIKAQRKLYKKNKLNQDRIQQLETIGFEWDLHYNQWQKAFKTLMDFKKIHLHCNVPKNYLPDLVLVRWVASQRQLYKKNKLSQDKIQKLETIGFEWDLHVNQWQKMFETLMDFKKIHLHCNVPQNYLQDSILAMWVTTQRQLYKKSKLSQDKVQKLNSIQFEWDPNNKQWQQMFKTLVNFKKTHHHCNVPLRYPLDPILARWVGTQRKLYKKDTLSQDKILELEAIGFEWDPHNVQWQQMFKKFCEFQENYHHSDVPQKYPQGVALANWIATQRKLYKKDTLSQDKILELEAIGFEWDPYNVQWQQMFKKLCEFKESYHHCNVPQGYPQDVTLASWVNTQRQAYKKHKLNVDKIQRLEDIGFQWVLDNH